MLAAILLLPRLLAAGAEPPPGTIRLKTPRVEYRINEASATRSPWIDSNGWQILRNPGRSFIYIVKGGEAGLAAAEAYTYNAEALISTDPAGTKAFGRMLDFLQAAPHEELTPVADIGIVDDGSAAMGEVLNLCTRLNLLFRIVRAPDASLAVNVRLGTAEYPTGSDANPTAFAHRVRSQLGDDRRSFRIFGSDEVIGRYFASGRKGRVCLLNYSSHPISGMRVRVRGAYSKGEPRIFGVARAGLEDWTRDGDATEFTVAELGAFAVIELFE